MNCPVCGTVNEEIAVFCVSCGSQLPQPVAPVTPVTTADVATSQAWAPAAQTPVSPVVSAAVDSSASRYFFMAPVLEHLTRGGILKGVVSWALRIGGVIVGLLGVLGIVSVLRGVFMGDSVTLTIAGLLMAAIAAVFTYMLVHTFFIRAQTVNDLPETHYVVVPIVSVILRMFGETSATCILFAGVSTLVAALFAGSSYYGGGYLGSMSYPLYGLVSEIESVFLAGLVALIISAMFAFFSLLLFYMLAELAVVLVDIAQNTDRTAKASGN